MAIKLSLQPTERILFCGSKWWGDPDMPENMQYPTITVNEEGETYDYPLTFICQINCEDIADLDIENKLPHEGMLYFFGAIDEILGYEAPYKNGKGEWAKGNFVVKYAKNIKAARYFINFMCMPENAVRNMDMTGYVSVIGGDHVLEAMSDEEEYDALDASYFFGDEADSVFVNPIMYPDKGTILRCGMMHDSDTEALLKMWSRVKGDNASAWTYILICLVFAGLIAAVVIKYTRRRYRIKVSRKHKTRRKNRPRY